MPTRKLRLRRGLGGLARHSTTQMKSRVTQISSGPFPYKSHTLRTGDFGRHVFTAAVSIACCSIRDSPPPNNALQRTEAGGGVCSEIHVLRRQPPSLSLGPLGVLRTSTRHSMNRRSTATWLGTYFVLLLPSLFIAAFIWQERVCGVLYYCSDSLPWELFCPGPFAHLDAGRYGHTGDYYVASEARLEQIRWCLLCAAGIVPALLLWPLSKLIPRYRTPNHALQRTEAGVGPVSSS